MKKILEWIGVRLWSFDHVEEYREKCINKITISLLFVVDIVLAIVCIAETVVN